MKSYLQLVIEWNIAFRYRQPEPTSPDLSDAATNKLRPELIREELRELNTALEENNRVEQLDALCDIQYVLSGAVLAWGYRSMIESMIPTVTLSKIRDVPGHVASMIGINRQMESAAESDYQHQVFTALVQLQAMLTRLVWNLGFSEVFGKAFAEVHRSNMSKLWAYEELDEAPATAFQEQVKGKWIVRRHDQKILKSPSYSPAELSQFV